MRYAYRLERHKETYWGSVIDLQVCIGRGRTIEALEVDLIGSIELWIESAIAHGSAIPESRSRSEHTVELTERTARLIGEARATPSA